MRTVIIAAAMTAALVNICPASACSWFEPCKPKIVKAKVKHSRGNLEKRVDEHHRRLEAYRGTIVSLSIAITKLNARVAKLEAARCSDLQR